jgi:hypothetical protein
MVKEFVTYDLPKSTSKSIREFVDSFRKKKWSLLKLDTICWVLRELDWGGNSRIYGFTLKINKFKNIFFGSKLFNFTFKYC